MALRHAGERAASPAAVLYRHISKQVPRVLTLYDIFMEPSDARHAIQALFRRHADVRDPRVVDLLIHKANMELQETLMQWKQKMHLLKLLDDGMQAMKEARRAEEPIDPMERFFANLDEDASDKEDEDEDDEDEDEDGGWHPEPSKKRT